MQMVGDTGLAMLADLVLLLHTMVAGFIVIGLLLVLLGAWRGWAWVRNPWFRYAHLIAIGIVIAESWSGTICPLTTWEMSLREAAGQATYSGSFIAHWLQALLYYDAPTWVFTTIYSGFGLLVGYAWWRVRPRKFFNVTKNQSTAAEC